MTATYSATRVTHEQRDSKFTTRDSIAKLGDLLELRVRAYIHKSEGRPGVDAGTGWTQDVIVVFGNGIIEGSITQWPADLYDGTLEIDGEASENRGRDSVRPKGNYSPNTEADI